MCRVGRNSTHGKCCDCKGGRCGHQHAWNQELSSSVLKKKHRNEKKTVDKEDNVSSSEDEAEIEKEETTKPKIKFPPTEATQKVFNNYEENFYNEKIHFVDEVNEGQTCLKHNNEWSREDPITQNWCFSDKIKLAHSSPVTKKDRKVYFRKTENEKCDCRLHYKGDEDFLLRIGGSTEAKNHTKTVSLVSYGLHT